MHRFSKSTQVPNFMIIDPVGAELFHADGQTDRHDADDGRFSQFCESATNGQIFEKQLYEYPTSVSRFVPR
jgi:hypothetical protein